MKSFARTDLTLSSFPDLNRTTSSKGSGMDMETIVDEICVTLQFIAEFMDKLPEETCMELARHVRMESANKDQVLARTGDEAHKFSLIVTGDVQQILPATAYDQPTAASRQAELRRLLLLIMDRQRREGPKPKTGGAFQPCPSPNTEEG